MNKFDLLEGDKKKEIENIKNNINEFFNKRRIKIEGYFITCGETIEGFEDVETYNDQVAEMILDIITTNE